MRPLFIPTSGLYAAPHVTRSQGIERPELSRYSRIADDVTGWLIGKWHFLNQKQNSHSARLLKISILPDHMKTFTKKEFSNAPCPAAGSASEQYADEDEMLVIASIFSTCF